MRVRFYSSFDRCYRRMRSLERKKTDAAIDLLLDALEQHLDTPPKGLGLKKLQGPIWEIRVDLQLRIIFTLENNLVSFVLVGSHDDVHRLLRRQR